MRTQLMKINSVYVGLGGYQNAQIGIWFDFVGSDGCGVGDGEGMWATEWSKHCKWSEQDRIDTFGKLMMKIAGWLNEAKVDSVDQLKGKPVEVTFDGNQLKSWRILTEVL